MAFARRGHPPQIPGRHSEINEVAPGSQIQILWNKEHLIFTLPPPPATLLDLKKLIAERTGLAPAKMKLISHGFQMKEDAVTLERYGLYDGDVTSSAQAAALRGLKKSDSHLSVPPCIKVIGSPDTQGRVSDRASSQAVSHHQSVELYEPCRTASSSLPSHINNDSDRGLDELGTLTRIARIRDDAMERHLPIIEALGSGTTMLPSLAKAVASASELLMQTLLALDSIIIPPEWETARRSRKQAVKTIQTALDKIDVAKERCALPATNTRKTTMEHNQFE